MANISCTDIVKSYGAHPVIEGMNLDIPDHEFVVFLGPSGCGKSTMLRMIAGLEEVTGGRIVIGGTDVTTLPPGERGVAMVFQSYALYPHMSVADNITFGLRRQGIARAEIAPRLAHVAQMLGLEPYLDRKPKNLSGGQQQRVAMARAMIKTPKVFLFDEPLSNLDAKLREKLRTEIRKMHLQLKTTTIFVTHDQLEAMTIADRIVLMRDGCIEQMGTPDEIFERPATRFVADFIGTPAMNFLHATMQDGHVARAGNIALRLSPTDFPRLRPGQKVELGLRPARMELCPEGTPGALTGTVVLVENMGAEGQVITDVDGHEMSFTTPAFRGLAIGDRVSFAIDPGHVHAFDPQSGHSLREE
ncbi:MAG: sn-glycerol-3-phosphate ABC transporter ATP-binding protein UgpC [Rhodobacteraceae bacterium]|mgnify:CR=1 FL=1|uniref:ABC transporter ATP-binding protein n=1 Tax=Salipiger sp. HF18 TaxID=2721557 RepID=UPI000C3D339E|nr:sn-glycerol-3-phosphate ABC transporter ATP-binding protein UgpC [Salipiger sp. HF18]MAU45976.1 sugar ABC transporter ATP-binding protein [Salipiger sp.]NIY96173.1 sn-glycerol-3-phosphate ABC transporter ATP-binding protein UgpC [Salipiger sp. HF18]NVK61865.1 sn-glycerol-3-phosphate ABC transporter ATP-binding protein UgpC [Paracoccaceae bacterium]